MCRCSHRTGVVAPGYRDGMTSLSLRPLHAGDADAVFEMMADPHSRHQAAFVHADPHDRAAFDAWWKRIVDDPRVRDRAIVRHTESGDELVGTIAAFDIEGDREVSFWVTTAMRGRGVATEALALLLDEEPERPLHARATADNVASRRVLESLGFRVVAAERSFAEGRGHEIDEVVYRLD